MPVGDGDFLMNTVRPWFVLAMLAVSLPAAGQSVGERIVARAEALEKKTRCVVGVSVTELTGGKSVASYRANDLFTPASNMKLVTSLVAMHKLGADFQFKTTVYLLDKDVVVAGGFDPLLGDPRVAADEKRSIYDDLDVWAGAVKRVSGGEINDVIVLTDGSPKTYRHADWPANQFGRWYSAPVAALNFNNNCIDVTFRADPAGPVPLLSPESRYFTVNNRIKAGNEAVWNLTFAAGDATVTITGTARASNSPQSTAVNDPPMLLARTLADRLARADVTIGGKLRAAASADVPLDKARPVAQTSTPLSLVLHRANKQSQNMVAECMLLAAGDGTWAGSAVLAGKTLADLGLTQRQFVVADGSGYSRHNRVTPAAMTTLLTKALSMKGSDAFLASLAVGGVDGTMSRRLAGEAKGRVLAKTGYIAGVSCLSGYVLDADGKPVYAFSVLVNKTTDLSAARTFQDEVCDMLVKAMKPRQATSDK